MSSFSPMGLAASLTGLPKKATRRGRKPSGKPGSDHLSMLQQAHGAGDMKAAKTHALNYAKAVHGMSQGMTTPDTEGDDTAAVSTGVQDDPTATGFSAVATPKTMPAKPTTTKLASPKAPVTNTPQRAKLAQLVKRMKA